ncbi:hypothetical protein BB561_000836 [Smittium simulii]|uniref:Uncharacterized protein n=1 Tax=Smittium simulii TaxID=133385 RepID=A0A2T9YXF8_9FUNG|nr:hypothetical protein BB561_000836 [Smittium simulii]
MPKVPGVIPSATAGVPNHSAKRFQSISASVIKNADISDHFPVMTVWHVPNILKTDETIIKIDRAKIQINSDKIINNNYYSMLNSSIKNNAEELGTNECIEKLLGASTSILNDLGVLNTPAMPKVLKLPKKIEKQ